MVFAWLPFGLSRGSLRASGYVFDRILNPGLSEPLQAQAA